MKPWVLFPTLRKSSVVAHACNHKLKAMPSCIGILGPNLDYMRSYLKNFHFKMIECTEYGNIGSLTIETSYPLALDHLPTKSSSRTTQVSYLSSAHPAAWDPSSRSFHIHSLKQHSSLVPHHRWRGPYEKDEICPWNSQDQILLSRLLTGWLHETWSVPGLVWPPSQGSCGGLG